MRSTTLLAAHPDFTLRQVRCRDDDAGWSPVEPVRAYGVVLVRDGRFRRTGRAGELFADRTLGYLCLPGDEERFAHPAGGDVCTSIHVSGSLWHQLPASGDRSAAGVYVDARLELAHRLLLRAAQQPDLEFATAERLLRLVGVAVATGGAARPVRPASPAAARTDRAAVEIVREAITAGDPAAGGLLPLARLAAISPYRLSRAFHREMGVPLTRFRNRVRVGQALSRLAAGESNLARLAVDLGFADQAHLTRTVRAHAGDTPAQLRRRLREGVTSPGPAGQSGAAHR